METDETYRTKLVVDSDEAIEDIQEFRKEVETLNESVTELIQTLEELPIPACEIEGGWVDDDE